MSHPPGFLSYRDETAGVTVHTLSISDDDLRAITLTDGDRALIAEAEAGDVADKLRALTRIVERIGQHRRETEDA